MLVLEEVSKLYCQGKASIKTGLAALAAGASRDDLLKQGFNLALDKISLEIFAGEIFVLVGLSGSGKSTSLRLFNGLVQPSSGNVFYDKRNICEFSAKEWLEFRRSKVSMVFQSFALLPHLNVLQNVCFALEIAGVSKKDREHSGMRMLERLNLSQYAKYYPRELSGGMQQRVGLGRALILDPPILLMDEAFSALDPLLRREMQDELLRLQGEQRRTVVFVSHDMEEASRVGDRIAVLSAGKVVQVGTFEELKQNPVSDYVKAFFN